MTGHMHTVAVVHSCYPERFGTPRQPGLTPAATAEVRLIPPYDDPEALRGLEGYSHVWLLYSFHANGPSQWTPTVRPPRLGGNRRLGVFATRSPFRPNPIGLSVVTLEAVVTAGDWRGLRIRNHDLVDGTPVLDIKPYLPYSDCLPEASGDPAFQRPAAVLDVAFDEVLAAAPALDDAQWRALAEETLALDPRPAYRRHSGDGGSYGVRIGDWNVRFRVDGRVARVLAIESPPTGE